MPVKRIIFGLAVEYDSDNLQQCYDDIQKDLQIKISAARKMFYNILSYEMLGFDEFVVLPRIMTLLRFPLNIVGDVFDIALMIANDIIGFETSDLHRTFGKIKKIDDSIKEKLAVIIDKKEFQKRLKKVIKDLKESNVTASAHEFSMPLVKYYSRFFKGEFVDRNGTSMQLDKEDLKAMLEQGEDIAKNILKSKGSSVKLDQASGELFSQLFSVVIELLFDLIFKVPFYCREIAEAKVLSKQVSENMKTLKGEMLKLEKLLKGVDLQYLPTRAQRMNLLKLNKLDEQYINTESNSKKINELSKLKGDLFKKLAEKYACYNAEVILDPIREINFACTGDNGENRDYAVLVGELTAQSSIKAGSAAKSGLASVIKGASIFSSNNETVTEAVATIGGVVAKKICEYAVYNLSKKIITDPNILDCDLTHINKKLTKRELIQMLHEIYAD